jgi:hypothetical protein
MNKQFYNDKASTQAIKEFLKPNPTGKNVQTLPKQTQQPVKEPNLPVRGR